MKFFSYIFLFLFAEISFAQKDSSALDGHALSQEPEIFTVVEEMPEFPGGTQQMMKFIQINSRYPQSMKEKSIGGKVFLKFVVNETGVVKDVVVLKSSGVKELDEEAKIMMSYMPKWKPGKQNGKEVSVYFNIPVSYGLGEPYFMFNISNKNADYLAAKTNLEKGDISSALANLKKAEDQTDVDILYTSGVIYSLKKNNKDACVCYSKINELYGTSNNKIVSNAKEYQQKYCTN
ncbi:MAG: energy transducer TonB [Bacteroidota bacterium]